jgi:hypothetical protein
LSAAIARALTGLLLQLLETGADLVGVGRVELGEHGQGPLPVVPGLVHLAAGVVRTGQAVVGAGLLVAVIELTCQRQGLAVLVGALPGMAGGAQCFPNAVARRSLPNRSPSSP